MPPESAQPTEPDDPPVTAAPVLPKRCQAHYAGLQCAFVLNHDHPHGNEDSGVYVTWGRMASHQQPTVGGTTLATEDVRALLALLLYVPDAVLRQRDHDALLRRVGTAMGRPL